MVLVFWMFSASFFIMFLSDFMITCVRGISCFSFVLFQLWFILVTVVVIVIVVVVVVEVLPVL
jgi:hypothetical protein